MALDGIIEMRNILDRLETAIPGPQVKEWLNNITDPSFGLVDDLINTFLDSVQEKDVSNNTLRILRQLNTHTKTNVLTQILNNKVFPSAMYKYITGTKPEDVCHDAYLLFTAIYTEEGFKDLSESSSELARSLFDALEYIREEKVYNAIIAILISASLENQEQFLELCSSHKNARYFGEFLLQVFNKSEGELLHKCIHCIRVILENPFTEGFFYTNDMRTLCDIVIQNLENLSENELKAKYFGLLKAIVKCRGFADTNHRIDEIKDLAEIFSNSENPEVKSNAEQTLEAAKRRD